MGSVNIVLSSADSLTLTAVVAELITKLNKACAGCTIESAVELFGEGRLYVQMTVDSDVNNVSIATHVMQVFHGIADAENDITLELKIDGWGEE